jgi:hypothetical protein
VASGLERRSVGELTRRSSPLGGGRSLMEYWCWRVLGCGDLGGDRSGLREDGGEAQGSGRLGPCGEATAGRCGGVSNLGRSLRRSGEGGRKRRRYWRLKATLCAARCADRTGQDYFGSGECVLDASETFEAGPSLLLNSQTPGIEGGFIFNS